MKTINQYSGGSARHARAEAINKIGFLGDSVMIICGLIFGFWLRFRSGIIPKIDFFSSSDDVLVEYKLTDYLSLVVVGAVLLELGFIKAGLYETRNLLRYQRVVSIVVRSAALWLMMYVSISLVLKFNPPISRIYALVSMFGVVVAVLVWRAIYYYVIRRANLVQFLRQRVIFVGWTIEANNLASAIRNDNSYPYEIVGHVCQEFGSVGTEQNVGATLLGKYRDLQDIIKNNEIDIVILTNDFGNLNSAIGLSNLCERLMVKFKVIPTYFQIMVAGLQLETISAVPILGVSELPLDQLSNKILKRSIDIFGSIVGLVLSVPIIVVFGIIIYAESPGPIFYRQVRAGRRGREFKIIKLRSMKLDAETAGGAQWAKKNDDRRLKIGAFMRATNIDEVPQFWNVLKGDMSLVGPRPERPELISKFQFQIPHYNARLMSKPGMTGWAQVNGLRGDTDLNERVRYDLYYLENWSLILDFQLMIQTFIKQKNAY